MEAKFKAVGHAVHPMLIVFPLGLLATASIFDGIRAATRERGFSEAAHYMLGAGVVSGLIAAVPGTVDYFAIPQKTRAKRVGLLHGLGNVAVTGMYAASWLLRRRNPGRPSNVAIALSTAGTVTALVTAWLGGELVERLGISVDRGAHADAPNSLSHRPASDSSIAA